MIDAFDAVEVGAHLGEALERAGLGAVLDVLESANVAFDRDQALKQAAEQGMFIGRFEQMRVDVFVPSIPFSWEAGRTRVRKTIAGRDLWFLSAEALCVFKLLFFRGKDLVDLERLVGVQGKSLDASYVRQHLVEMMGSDNVRVAKWDELIRNFGG